MVTLLYERKPDRAHVCSLAVENMSMRKERSKWEIIKDILKAIAEEKKLKKTRIMQRACLDWTNFQRYFNFLLEEGFIIKPGSGPDNRDYELTEKGKELLGLLKAVDAMIP